MASRNRGSLLTDDEMERLSNFCRDMFLNLSRSDQKRWGEIYVRGLISVPGRKSIRGISHHVMGAPADQGIQQFVNQSPWESEPVRHNLAELVNGRLRPQAWVIEEVVLPKNGSSSVAVTRQYAPSARRVMNCQLGLGLFMVGGGAAIPVDWRLLMPPEWDTDLTRRARAHVPEGERHRSRWQILLEMITEVGVDWQFDVPPIVLDARHDADIAPLVRGLDERGLSYVIRVAPGAVVTYGHQAPITAGHFSVTFGRAAAGETSVNWREDLAGPGTRSRFIMKSLPRATAAEPASWRNRTRYLLAEWLPGKQRPAGLWLTNLHSPQMPHIIGLAHSQHRATAEMARLSQEFGLAHFEGRSFRGWHHHATLVSLAHAFVELQKMDRDNRGVQLRGSLV
jgi:SRSO17 transposase